jgi:hypothetical protein
MPMANLSQPADLDFQGGTCDIDAAGTAMRCRFQQVFLAPAPEDRATCRIVTNHYDQAFARRDARAWVASEGPDGPCATMTVTTLERGEGSLPAYWRVTLTIERAATLTSAACAGGKEVERLASTAARRPLGCSFVSAGSLEF